MRADLLAIEAETWEGDDSAREDADEAMMVASCSMDGGRSLSQGNGWVTQVPWASCG
jgi:hypothetical protein